MGVLVNPATGTAGKKTGRSVIADSAVLFSAKWNQYQDLEGGGTEVDAATIEQKAAGLEFLANGVADVGINSYTGASGAAGNLVYANGNADTVGKVLAIINGVAPGQPAPTDAAYMARWRAGLGDFRPGFGLGATSGAIALAVNALLGLTDAGAELFGNTSGLETADLYSVGIGTGRSKSGGGQVFADHFESAYESDTSGSRFSVRAGRRRQEEQPGLAQYAVALTEIRADMAYASDAKVVTVYDINDNIVATFPIGSGVTVGAVSEATPLVGPVGSPLFVECVGSGALTDGPLSVSGEIRIA